MKTTLINKSHIEGYLYDHSLEMKKSGEHSKNPGTEFIMGTISIATDEAGINIVPVHFTYVTATTKKGGTNPTFTTLKNIIDGAIGTQMKDGKEKAGKLRIDSAIGLNEFFTDKSGKEELVSAKRNEGGLVHVCDVLNEDEKTRNTFECDMIISNCYRVEANEEKGTPEKVIVKGVIFDFSKALLPVEFTATNPNAMNYFEDLGASQSAPVFTKVWGRQVSEIDVKKTVEESAFGEAIVKETKNTRRDFVITGASKVPYIWDDESGITGAEFKELLAKREVYLATIKQRQDEYKASKNAPAAAPATIPTAGFNF